jgi:putative transposase
VSVGWPLPPAAWHATAQDEERKLALTPRVWSTLKTEYYDRHHWATKAEAKQAVGAWIEDRYNRRRRHSSIGMVSPVAFEQAITTRQEAAA